MLIFFFFRKQSPLAIVVEILFLLFLVAAFGASYFPDRSLHQPFGEERLSIAKAAAEETASPSGPESEGQDRLPVAPLASFVQAAVPVETPAVDLPGDLECQELIVNGGFESFRGWTLPITDRPAAYTSERAASGQRSLKLGLDTGDQNLESDSSAVQIVDLPAEAEHIELSAQIWRGSSSEDTDVQYLTVRAGEQTLTIFHGQANERAWETITYDLTPFRGQQVRVIFGAYNTGDRGKVVLYVDQVSVQACRAISTAPTATVPTATATADTATVTRSPSPTPTSTPRPVARRDHAPMAEMRSPDYAVNTFLWSGSDLAGRDLSLVEDAGFRWVRQRFDWTAIEAQQGEFDWQESDRVVQQVNDQGLSLLALLTMDHGRNEFWAGDPPQNIDDFTDFVSKVAERYDCTSQAVGCIQAYQIWREPNLARTWGGNRPNPAQYLSMLEEAYAAIKAANPNAIVISAGLAPTGTSNASVMPDVRFYREMYRLMDGSSQGYFDMLGAHAPGFAAPPEVSPAQAATNPQYGGQRFFTFRHVEDIRNIMVANGDVNTRIAIVEFGWTSDAFTADNRWFGIEAGIDEFVKADYLTRAYAYADEHWQPWIGLMSVFTMPNVEWISDGNPFDEEHYWWSIVEPGQADELRLRPAYMALCTYLNELQGEECPHD
jgi:polysaccharide biosynthesis protein PslG